MVLFVIGQRCAGKTPFIQAVQDGLKKSGVKTGGIFSPAPGEKAVHYVESFKTGKRLKLLDRTANGPVPDKAGFAFARNVLARLAAKDVALIDEFGRLEIRGEGYFKEAKKVCARCRHTVITIRGDIAQEAAAMLELPRHEELILGENGFTPETVNRALAWLSK